MKHYFTQKKLLKGDLTALLVFLFCAFHVFQGMDRYSFVPRTDLVLSNPYLAQADAGGNTWVIDEERSRVVKIDQKEEAVLVLKRTLREADTFWYAEDLAFGPDGAVYLLDASWDETGSRVGRECILAYGADGAYEDTLLDVVYEENRPDKHKLFALQYRDGMLYYVLSQKEGFSVCAVSVSTGERKENAFYSYENAFNLIQDYTFHPDSGAVYALDKRGRILEGTDGKLTVLYDTKSDGAYAGRTAFYRIAADREGGLYVTDIRQNAVYRLDKNGPEVFMDRGQVLGVTWATCADGSTLLGMRLDSGIVVQDPSGGQKLGGDTFRKGGDYLMRETCFQAAALLLLLAGLWLLARLGIWLLGFRVSEVQKNGILAAGTAAVVSVIIVSQMLNQFAGVYREELLNRLYIMAHTISGMVDAGSVERIRTSEDYMGEDYQALMKALETGMNREDASVREMYCNVLKYEDGKGYAIAYLDNSIGTYYPRDETETQELKYIYDLKKVVRNDGKDDETGSYIYVRAPVLGRQGNVAGVIEVGTTKEVITDKVQEMRRSVMLIVIMVVLIVLFLFGEILSFFDLQAKYREEQRAGQPVMPMHMLRCGIFITYMAFNVASSFLPVYVAGFVTGRLGIPRELAASLPITLNMIFIGAMSLFCARILLRFSFRAVAGASACICMAGDVMMFAGQSYLWMVAGLILNGIGVGMITNSVNMFIAGSSDDKMREDGFSLFNAGSLSGINCGMMLGASLAGIVGQRMVFGCSAAAWGLVAVLFFFMGKYMKGGCQGPKGKEKKNMGKFLASRGVLPYLFLIQLPYVVINSFVFYYVPIYGSAQGFSESVVCLFLMLNSLCSVYLSVAVTGFVTRRLGEWSIYLSSFLSFAGLLMFGWKSTAPMLVLVLLLLGLASSFGSPVRQLFFTRLPGVREYGEESAMGVFNFMDNAGESAGPVLFGSIMAGPGVLTGLAGFAAVSGAMNAVYAVLFGRHKKARKG